MKTADDSFVPKMIEYENAPKLIPEEVKRLSSMSDYEFVATVRQLEALHQTWPEFYVWTSAVRQEIDMRLLLKKCSACQP